MNPDWELVQTSLDDLKQPLGERHGPFPFHAGNWIAETTLNEFRQQMSHTKSTKLDAIRRMARGVLRRHPEWRHIVPLLLNRGDRLGVQAAIILATYGEDPELHEALRTFIGGPFGTDQQRLNTSQEAHRLGILEPGLMTVWIEGEPTEVMQLNFEIDEDPSDLLPESVMQLAIDAYDAMVAGDLEQAEELYLEAIRREPNLPSLHNNLASVYLGQWRDAEAEAIIERMTVDYPDYFFGIVANANLARRRGDTKTARSLLDPLLLRKKVHISEFRGLCRAYIQLHGELDEPQAAEAWLSMWASIEPESPDVAELRARLASRNRERKGPRFWPFAR